MNHCVNFLLLSIILKFHVNSPWTQHELNIIIGSRGLVYTCERIQMVEKWAWDHFIIVIGKIRWAKSESIKFRLTQKPPVDRFWQPLVSEIFPFGKLYVMLGLLNGQTSCQLMFTAFLLSLWRQGLGISSLYYRVLMFSPNRSSKSKLINPLANNC